MAHPRWPVRHARALRRLAHGLCPGQPTPPPRAAMRHHSSAPTQLRQWHYDGHVAVKPAHRYRCSACQKPMPSPHEWRKRAPRAPKSRPAPATASPVWLFKISQLSGAQRVRLHAQRSEFDSAAVATAFADVYALDLAVAGDSCKGARPAAAKLLAALAAPSPSHTSRSPHNTAAT